VPPKWRASDRGVRLFAPCAVVPLQATAYRASMKHSLLASSAVALLLIAQVTSAGTRRSSRSCISVGGVIAARLLETPSGQAVVGSVTGTLAGAVHGVPSPPEVEEDGSLRLGVTDHFVLEDGSVLQTQAEAHLVPVPGREGAFHQVASYEVVSGSGRFEDAHGTFTGHGEADLARGQVTVRYEGRLCGVGR